MSDDNILSKLFDTLRHASDRNEEATQKLIVQQLDLVNHIKNMPIHDLKVALQNHAKDSKDDIDDCSGTVVTKSDDIMEFLRQLNMKITKLIVGITVVVLVATGGYFVIRYAAEKGAPPAKWEERLRSIEQDQHEDIDEKLKEFMDEIRKEMRKNHSEEKADEPVHE
jgi:hypothetical protein